MSLRFALSLCATCFVALISSFRSWGVDAPVVGEDETPQSSVRINAYFANIPDYAPPCDDPELIYDPALLAAIPEADRFAFQSVRRKRDAQLEEVEKLRKAVIPLHEDWLFAALDYHAELRAYENSDQSYFLFDREWQDREAVLQRTVLENYLFHLQGLVDLYFAESELRSIVKDYYTRISQPPATPRPFRITFFDDEDPEVARKREAANQPPKPSPFDGLTIAKQRRFLDAFRERLKCLREERLKAFHALSKNTIELEISVSKYIEATRNEKVKIDDTTRVDEANAQIERAVLQQKYLWLMEEFATHSAIYKVLLFAHERKLRNTSLFTILQARQEAHPFLGPNSDLPQNYPGLAEAQTQVSRVRLQIALVTSMEDEAKLEAASVANASSVRYFLDTLQGEAGKWFEGMKSLATWLRDKKAARNDPIRETGWTGLAAFVGISYQFASNSFNAILMTPLKDTMIKGARGTNLVDGWKTSTQDNYERYLQAAGLFSPRMKFLENLEKNLSPYRASQLLGEIVNSRSGVLYDLLSDHTFNSATQGGMAYILEPFFDRPAEFKALWLHCAEPALAGAFQTARDRIAAARGIEIENPLREAAVSDIRLGATSVLNENSDVLFKIPSMWRNFVGQFTSAYQSQVELMEEMESQRKEMGTLLGKLQDSRVRYSLPALRRMDQSAYETYIGLAQTCLEWNVADYNIRQDEWNRAKRYNSVVEKLRNRNERFEGELTLTELQRQEEERFAVKAVRQGYLKLKYMIHTANYSAAVLQTKKLEELENIRRRVKGITAKADYRALAAELHLMAVSNQAVVAWEGLLNQAITTVITSKFSTYMHERVLSHFDDKWLKAYQASSSSVNVGSEMLNTFVPWTKVYGKTGMLNLVTGTGMDLVKSQIAEEIAEAANAYTGKRGNLEGADLEPIVGELFDLGNDLRGQLQEIALTNFVMRRVETYAATEAYENALQTADEAREGMKGAFLRPNLDEFEVTDSENVRNTLDELFDVDYDALSSEEKQRFIQDTVDNEGGNIRMDVTQEAFEKYRLALVELETQHAAYEDRIKTINSVLFYGAKISKSVENAVGELEKMQWKAYQSISDSRSQASGVRRALAGTRDLFYENARAELRTRILLGSHTIEDLEAMVSDDPDINLNMPNLLLRRSDDIDALRRTLNRSLEEAVAKKGGSTPRENNPDYDRVMRVAEAIDEIRIGKINGLLAQFMQSSGHGEKVEMVIQGGAAKGNPEYQGIFGDIDFTLMLKGHAVAESDQIKADLLEFFEKAGYPLARSKEDPSSMDSEAFVQPFDRFDTAQADLKDAVADIVEKNRDPTRFYSEGGTEWFINNAAYSGMLLWPRGNQRVKWVDVDPTRGHGLAIDMARYLGFLASPKYTKKYLDEHPADRREYLETALGKSKYFLRLIDAYEIGHPTGNIEYNKRKDINSNDRKDKSYHWQIYEDAKKIVENPDPNDPNPVFKQTDLDHIEVIAMMKMKGDFASPWEAIRKKYPNLSEAEQMDKAQGTIDWMRTKAPAIFSYLDTRWHASANERARSSNPQVRANLRAEKHRKMSVVKAIMQNDGPWSIVFLVPRMLAGKPLTEAEHAAEIQRRIGVASGVTPINQPIDRASRAGEGSIAEIDRDRSDMEGAVAEAKALAKAPAAGVDVMDLDDLFRDWLGSMLSAGTGAN